MLVVRLAADMLSFTQEAYVITVVAILLNDSEYLIGNLINRIEKLESLKIKCVDDITLLKNNFSSYTIEHISVNKKIHVLKHT